jgi:hypothetical protein
MHSTTPLRKCFMSTARRTPADYSCVSVGLESRILAAFNPSGTATQYPRSPTPPMTRGLRGVALPRELRRCEKSELPPTHPCFALIPSNPCSDLLRWTGFLLRRHQLAEQRRWVQLPMESIQVVGQATFYACCKVLAVANIAANAEA